MLEAELAGLHLDVPIRWDLPNLVRTRSVIEETLRLYPPVPLQARTAKRTAFIDRRRVRAGDILVVAAWLLHRNRDYWALPDQFVPERFNPKREARPRKYLHIPFSVGPRVCPGLTFAMTEAVICLATLVKAFHFELLPGHQVHPVCRLTLRPGEQLPMIVTARGP